MFSVYIVLAVHQEVESVAKLHFKIVGIAKATAVIERFVE